MSIWRGHTTGCLWFYFHGDLTEADWDAYMEHLELHTRLEGALTETSMIISYRSGSPTPTMRRRVADFMRDRQAVLAHLKGNAMVADSAVARGTLIAVNWLFKKPFDERVFPEPRAALRWVEEISEVARADEIWREIARAVPAGALWPDVGS
jgi:hypothetical protein